MSGNGDLRSGLFGLGGVFLGGLLTWMVLAPTAPVGADGGASEELLAAQLRSERLLERIAETLPGLASAGGAAAPVRESVGDSTPAALLTRLETLDATLTKLTGALAGGRSGSRVPTPLVLEGVRAHDVGTLEQVKARPDVEVDLQHLGWTMQQVLDVYGRPTEYYADNDSIELRLFYDLTDGSLGFYFIDGRVVKVID